MGIFVGIVPLFPSLETLAVSQPDFSLPSLHPKIPFPAARVFDGQIPVGCREFLGFGEAKSDVRTRSVTIADSIQGLRTVGSILPEHHEVARLQYPR